MIGRYSHASLERGVTTTDAKVDTPLDPPGDFSLIQQYQQQLFDYKKDLTDVYESLLGLDLDEGDELLTFHARLETLIFDCCHKMKRKFNAHSVDTAAPSLTIGGSVRLPKLDVPTFTFHLGDNFLGTVLCINSRPSQSLSSQKTCVSATSAQGW